MHVGSDSRRESSLGAGSWTWNLEHREPPHPRHRQQWEDPSRATCLAQLTSTGFVSKSASDSGISATSYGSLGRGSSPATASPAFSSYSSPSQGYLTSSSGGSSPLGSGYPTLRGTSPSQGYVTAGLGEGPPSSYGSSGGSSPSQGYVRSSPYGASPSSYGTSGSSTPSQGYVTSSSGGGSPSSFFRRSVTLLLRQLWE